MPESLRPKPALELVLTLVDQLLRRIQPPDAVLPPPPPPSPSFPFSIPFASAPVLARHPPRHFVLAIPSLASPANSTYIPLYNLPAGASAPSPHISLLL